MYSALDERVNKLLLSVHADTTYRYTVYCIETIVTLLTTAVGELYNDAW